MVRNDTQTGFPAEGLNDEVWEHGSGNSGNGRMILCIADVVPSDLLVRIRKIISGERFVDGRETAGWHAKLVKDNRQAGGLSAVAEKARIELVEALRTNEVFRSAVLPRAFRPLLFSRYEVGMAYGTHVDDAIMGNDDPARTDVSFTVFLGSPDTYDGGELVIESPGGEQAYKLEPGHAIVYPSTSLHRVEAVTRGVREVAVGWVQSLVRDPARREILFDLETTRLSLFHQHGKTREFDYLSKTYANLLRMWAEV